MLIRFSSKITLLKNDENHVPQAGKPCSTVKFSLIVVPSWGVHKVSFSFPPTSVPFSSELEVYPYSLRADSRDIARVCTQAIAVMILLRFQIIPASCEQGLKQPRTQCSL